MSRRNPFYRSPYTNEPCSQEVYLEEWDKICKKLKSAWHLDVTAIDPGVSVLDGLLKGDPRYYYSSTQLPMWLVLRMIQPF